MDIIINEILKKVDMDIRETDDELKLFKVMLLVFYIYHGENHKEINPSNKLYKLSKKDRSIIENQIYKHGFFNEKMELYKLGLEFDKLIEATNRLETGSFYTPEKLSVEIVKLTLSDYYKDKDDDLYNLFRKDININDFGNSSIELQTLIRAYRSLCSLNVADLSCGTGMFLLSYINLIIVIRLRINQCSNDLEQLTHNRLEKFSVDRVFAFDIQENPLKILKLSIIDLVMRYDFIVYDTLNIYCYDTLKASNTKILKNKYAKDGFDIIFGNPPYIGEKGNKNIFEDIKKSKFGLKFYEGKMDYFYYFIYKGISLLKDGGLLGYITTNYFVSADGAFKLREYIKSTCNFLSIVNFNDIVLFSSAPGQHNMVFTLNKKTSKEMGDKIRGKDINVVVINREDVNKDHSMLESIYKYGYHMSGSSLYDENGKIILIKDGLYHNIIENIIKKSNMRIADFISVKQGIVSGADKVSKMMIEKKISSNIILKYNIKKDDPIFVVEENNMIDIEKKFLKPFYKNSCIDSYFVANNTSKSIVYINDEIDDFEKKYPKAYAHLDKYREVLSARREVVKGVKDWYLLQWGRSEKVFEKKRIVVPQRSSLNKFALSSKDFYGSADIYYLYINEKMGLEEDSLNYYLLGILNSKLYYFWLYNMGKRKGNLLELYSKPISQIPIYMDGENEFYSEIVINVKKLFLINDKKIAINEKISETNLIKDKIDQLIYSEYGLDNASILMIEDLFDKNILDKFKK